MFSILSGALGLAITPDGTSLIIADAVNHVLRVMHTTTRAVRTLAGVANEFGYSNGLALSSTFNRPVDISLNTNGTLLVVADSWNHVIRGVTLRKGAQVGWEAVEAVKVSTLAGIEASPGLQDGSSFTAKLHSPAGLVLLDEHTFVRRTTHAAGSVVVISDTKNGILRMLNVDTGIVSTVAREGTNFRKSVQW